MPTESSDISLKLGMTRTETAASLVDENLWSFVALLGIASGISDDDLESLTGRYQAILNFKPTSRSVAESLAQRCINRYSSNAELERIRELYLIQSYSLVEYNFKCLFVDLASHNRLNGAKHIEECSVKIPISTLFEEDRSSILFSVADRIYQDTQGPGILSKWSRYLKDHCDRNVDDPPWSKPSLAAIIRDLHDYRVCLVHHGGFPTTDLAKRKGLKIGSKIAFRNQEVFKFLKSCAVVSDFLCKQLKQ